MKWLRNLFRREPPVLICMRLADMYLVHPDQITSICSSCNAAIGIYPSGQQAMRDHPGIKPVCQVCMPPGVSVPAPGALQERGQSVRKQ